MSRQYGFLETLSPQAFEEMFELGFAHVSGTLFASLYPFASVFAFLPPSLPL